MCIYMCGVRVCFTFPHGHTHIPTHVGGRIPYLKPVTGFCCIHLRKNLWYSHDFSPKFVGLELIRTPRLGYGVPLWWNISTYLERWTKNNQSAVELVEYQFKYRMITCPQKRRFLLTKSPNGWFTAARVSHIDYYYPISLIMIMNHQSLATTTIIKHCITMN